MSRNNGSELRKPILQIGLSAEWHMDNKMSAAEINEALL